MLRLKSSVLMKEGANVVEPGPLLLESARCCRGACPFIGGGTPVARLVCDWVRLCKDEEEEGAVAFENGGCEENKADLGLFWALGAGDGDAEPIRAKGLLRTDMTRCQELILYYRCSRMAYGAHRCRMSSTCCGCCLFWVGNSMLAGCDAITKRAARAS